MIPLIINLQHSNQQLQNMVNKKTYFIKLNYKEIASRPKSIDQHKKLDPTSISQRGSYMRFLKDNQSEDQVTKKITYKKNNI